ncbi:MAG: GTPase Era [Gemmatimonadota bacterium]|jgi:GTP-binding protein Era|nr:GTPase Era [Gemmatimonadota bacterium]MDQ8167472.1 GTPase Era [Gemmatimonadota bacterium]MDQ8171986.1 GTPase Era [Gemmatimonadota bacterium]
MTRAGIVTVAGFPNAGKSTLLNRLVGEKLAITSSKAQSTRHRILGLRSEGDTQMVVLDTPGLLEPKDTLHSAMRNAALAAVRDADVLVHVVDATATIPEDFASAAGLERAPRAPVLLALNKIDLIDEPRKFALLGHYPDAVLLSAFTGDGMDRLVDAITRRLPESPFLYPADELSTQPVKFFCAEFVRETALEQLGDELPHALACEIEEFREGSSPLYIRAVLHVERESQKRIVIGANGQQIKKLGRVAREKIERFVGQPVYLDLWVKVLPNWRRNRNAVLRLGYGEPNERA